MTNEFETSIKTGNVALFACALLVLWTAAISQIGRMFGR